MIDVHPDELLHRPSLSDDERARLEAHLKQCRACAIEVQLANDFRDEEQAATNDDALIARSIDRALAAPPARRRKVLPYVLVAAAVMFTFFAWAKLHRAPEPLSPTPVVTVPPPPPVATPSVEIAQPAPSVEAPPPTIIEAPKPQPSVAPKPSAAELFASANEARRTGAVDQAVTLYRQLQMKYPSSPETLTSRIAFGRLLLDKLGDAPGARAQFTAYLAAAPTGTLAEEGRVGLALSAAKVGDAAGERAAWQDLLKNHPESVHAERARKRIVELGP